MDRAKQKNIITISLFVALQIVVFGLTVFAFQTKVSTKRFNYTFAITHQTCSNKSFIKCCICAVGFHDVQCWSLCAGSHSYYLWHFCCNFQQQGESLSLLQLIPGNNKVVLKTLDRSAMQMLCNRWWTSSMPAWEPSSSQW